MTLPARDSAAVWGVPYADYKPVEDVTTDLSSVAFNEMAADVAMSTHTIGRAIVRFTGTTYTSGTQAITVVDHDALWGSSTGVKPTVVQTSAGRYIATWATTQSDELQVSHTINIRFPRVWFAGATDGNAKVVSWTANTVTLQTSNTSWVANALNANDIFVAWV